MTVAVSTVSSMFDLANEYLGALVAAMSTTEAGAPDRSFVSLGSPAWETSCAQAAVQVLVLTEEGTRDTAPAGQTGRRISRGRVNLVGMVGYAIRCIQASQGNNQAYLPPSDDQLTAEAKAAHEDGWAVWNYVTRANLAGNLFNGPCEIVHFDGGAPVTPAGGLGGWQFTMRVELGGYDPT